MKQLIVKDIRLIGIINLVIIGIGIIGGGMGVYVNAVYKSNFAYGFTMIVTLFLVNNMIIGKESKSKSDPLMISMPVK